MLRINGFGQLILVLLIYSIDCRHHHWVV